MKKYKLIVLIFIFFSSTSKSQTNSLTISNLLDCFIKGQTEVIEYASNTNLYYTGIEEEDSEHKTLKFSKSNNFELNLTYKTISNRCVFLQLICADNKLFYKIKNEILNLKPQFIKTYNENNGVISIYEGNKFTYKIITDNLYGVRVNVITISKNI